MNALHVILLAGFTVGIDARADTTDVYSLDFDCPLRVCRASVRSGTSSASTIYGRPTARVIA